MTKETRSGLAPDPCSREHIGAQVGQAARVIRRAMDVCIAAQVTPELTGVRGMLLGEIIRANREGRPVYQRDVEKWMELRRSSVTAVLQGLEQDGFITRCSVEQDARLKRLEATPKGVAYHGCIHDCIERFERELHRGLTDAEMEQARAMLDRLLENARYIVEQNEK